MRQNDPQSVLPCRDESKNLKIALWMPDDLEKELDAIERGVDAMVMASEGTSSERRNGSHRIMSMSVANWVSMDGRNVRA